MKLNFPLQLYLATRPLARESRHSGAGVSWGEEEYYASVGDEAQTSCFLPQGIWQYSRRDFVSLLWFKAFLFFPSVQGRLCFCIPVSPLPID